MKESDKSVTPVSISPVYGSEDEILRESFIQNDTLEEEGEELNETVEEFNEKGEELNETGEKCNVKELDKNGEELNEKGEELNEKGEELLKHYNGKFIIEDNSESIVSEEDIILPEEVHGRENPFEER